MRNQPLESTSYTNLILETIHYFDDPTNPSRRNPIDTLDTHKKNKLTHVMVKSIHSPLSTQNVKQYSCKVKKELCVLKKSYKNMLCRVIVGIILIYNIMENGIGATKVVVVEGVFGTWECF